MPIGNNDTQVGFQLVIDEQGFLRQIESVLSKGQKAFDDFGKNIVKQTNTANEAVVKSHAETAKKVGQYSKQFVVFHKDMVAERIKVSQSEEKFEEGKRDRERAALRNDIIARSALRQQQADQNKKSLGQEEKDSEASNARIFAALKADILQRNELSNQRAQNNKQSLIQEEKDSRAARDKEMADLRNAILQRDAIGKQKASQNRQLLQAEERDSKNARARELADLKAGILARQTTSRPLEEITKQRLRREEEAHYMSFKKLEIAYNASSKKVIDLKTKLSEETNQVERNRISKEIQEEQKETAILRKEYQSRAQVKYGGAGAGNGILGLGRNVLGSGAFSSAIGVLGGGLAVTELVQLGQAASKVDSQLRGAFLTAKVPLSQLTQQMQLANQVAGEWSGKLLVDQEHLKLIMRDAAQLAGFIGEQNKQITIAAAAIEKQSGGEVTAQQFIRGVGRGFLADEDSNTISTLARTMPLLASQLKLATDKEDLFRRAVEFSNEAVKNQIAYAQSEEGALEAAQIRTKNRIEEFGKTVNHWIGAIVGWAQDADIALDRLFGTVQGSDERFKATKKAQQELLDLQTRRQLLVKAGGSGAEDEIRQIDVWISAKNKEVDTYKKEEDAAKKADTEIKAAASTIQQEGNAADKAAQQNKEYLASFDTKRANLELLKNQTVQLTEQLQSGKIQAGYEGFAKFQIEQNKKIIHSEGEVLAAHNELFDQINKYDPSQNTGGTGKTKKQILKEGFDAEKAVIEDEMRKRIVDFQRFGLQQNFTDQQLKSGELVIENEFNQKIANAAIKWKQYEGEYLYKIEKNNVDERKALREAELKQSKDDYEFAVQRTKEIVESTNANILDDSKESKELRYQNDVAMWNTLIFTAKTFGKDYSTFQQGLNRTVYEHNKQTNAQILSDEQELSKLRLENMADGSDKQIAQLDATFAEQREKYKNNDEILIQLDLLYAKQRSEIYKKEFGILENGLQSGFSTVIGQAIDPFIERLQRIKAFFPQMTATILSELQKLAAAKIASKAFEGILSLLFPDAGGTTGHSAGGNLLSTIFGKLPGASLVKDGFASGGYTGEGSKYTVAGVVHAGEGVLTREEVSAIGGRGGFNALRRGIRGYAHGGIVEDLQFDEGDTVSISGNDFEQSLAQAKKKKANLRKSKSSKYQKELTEFLLSDEVQAGADKGFSLSNFGSGEEGSHFINTDALLGKGFGDATLKKYFRLQNTGSSAERQNTEGAFDPIAHSWGHGMAALSGDAFMADLLAKGFTGSKENHSFANIGGFPIPGGALAAAFYPQPFGQQKEEQNVPKQLEENTLALKENTKATIDLHLTTKAQAEELSPTQLAANKKTADSADEVNKDKKDTTLQDAMIAGFKGSKGGKNPKAAGKAIIQSLLSSVPGVGGILGSLFGGLPGFADGGTPPIGMPYKVGERGPEYRIDALPGRIISHSDAANYMRMANQSAYNGGSSVNHYNGGISEKKFDQLISAVGQQKNILVRDRVSQVDSLKDDRVI